MTRFMIEKTIEFDMGHCVPTHVGKCKNLHGHRYKVVVGVSCPELPDTGTGQGMVMDFGEIKKIMTLEIHDLLDHKTMLSHWDSLLDVVLPPAEQNTACFECEKAKREGGSRRFSMFFKAQGFALHRYVIVPFVPTAENLARFCYERLKQPIDDEYEEFGVFIEHVKVWETPNSLAVFRPGGEK